MTTLKENPGQTMAGVAAAPIRPRRRRRNLFAGLSLTLVGFMSLLVLYPIIAAWLRTLFPAGALDVTPFADVYGSSIFWRSVRNSLILVVASGFFAVIIGSVLAWVNERTDAAIPSISRILPVIPLLMPSIALAIGWVFLGDSQVGYLNLGLRQVLGAVGVDVGATGPINIATWPGLIFVYTIFLTPYPYLFVSAALQNLDRSLEEASRMSGASLLRTVRKVSLPSIRPAIIMSLLLLTVEGISVYSIPVILGTRAQINTLSVYTVNLITGSFPSRVDDAVVVSFFMVFTLGPIWYAGRRLQRSGHHARIGGRGSTSPIALGAWRIPAKLLVVLYMLLTAVLPLLVILMVSVQPYWTTTIDFAAMGFDNYRDLFASPFAAGALQNSLVLGLTGATVTTAVAGVVASYISYTRGNRRGFLVGEAVDATLKLPAALSTIVVGLAILVALGGPPFGLYGTTVLLFLAYLAVFMPSASTAAMAAAGQVGNDLTEASSMAGASSARTFRMVSLPLMRSGLASGWALVFVSTLGDLTIAALLAGGPNPAVGFMMLNLWTTGTFSQVAAFAVLITVLCLVGVGGALAVGRGRRKNAR